mgnify:CR=1 FL=1
MPIALHALNNLIATVDNTTKGRIERHERPVVGYVPQRERIDTTPGRVIFNRVLPLDVPFLNRDIAKEELGNIVRRVAI